MIRLAILHVPDQGGGDGGLSDVACRWHGVVPSSRLQPSVSCRLNLDEDGPPLASPSRPTARPATIGGHGLLDDSGAGLPQTVTGPSAGITSELTGDAWVQAHNGLPALRRVGSREALAWAVGFPAERTA